MNHALATAAYNTAFALLLLDSLVPCPPLRHAAGKVANFGHKLAAAQARADRTRALP
ncbi:hypothetical protein [Amycolatopsis sp. NPDC006125]|uniref:hypothetical protein n=1 Tax=Amycolatopsis sp. NPDC006125 TaxID=3156730 RepID=UPI0033BB0CC7